MPIQAISPAESSYVVFRASDLNLVVAEPNRSRKCLRIAQKAMIQKRYKPEDE